MIFRLWDFLFLAILFISTLVGIQKGFLRSLSFLSAHLFSAVLSLVFATAVGTWVTAKLNVTLGSHFPSFLILYLLPMIFLTQLFRAMYKRNTLGKPQVSGIGHFGGFFIGLILGSFFSLLLSWILLLQPMVAVETIHSLGGTLFSRAAQLLQFFMRFYV